MGTLRTDVCANVNTITGKGSTLRLSSRFGGVLLFNLIHMEYVDYLFPGSH